MDSDFSIDENDEPVSDHEEEGQKKKRRLVTKAYKVCLLRVLCWFWCYLSFLRNQRHSKPSKNKNQNLLSQKFKHEHRLNSHNLAKNMVVELFWFCCKNAVWLIVERKSIRKSTAAKSAATALRVKVRNLEQKKKVKKPKEEEWVPTQEELLEEAKITEQENLASLGECL